MNELYGVDPRAPEGAGELIHLLRLFGPSEGRFIADFPTEWLSEVKALLEGESPLSRDRALAFLHRRRNALLHSSCHFVPNRPWAENAKSLQPLARGLIGPRGCPPTLLPIDDVLYNESALPDARGAHLPRTAAAYAQAASPLFGISTKVVLVDPYFRLRYRDKSGRFRVAARQRRALRQLLVEAASRRKTCVFCVQASARHALEFDASGKQFESDLEDIATEAGTSSLALEYGLLDEDPNAAIQHARYLLGVGCGLQFDHGFDTVDVDDGSRNHVHWLSAAELEPLLVRFDLPS